MNLDELSNKTILLFGRSRAFSSEEFNDQMKYHGIDVVKEYGDEVVLAVDGRMMTPYEQNASDELYESGKLKAIPIDALENLLACAIDEDTLLMSLKLSHDKDRLKSFLQNEMISDTLFLRLIKLYSWGNEDFFENDDNRDVSAAFISRFYENIERNHNVQYATTGFIHLVAQTRHVDILKAITELKPLQFHPKINSAIAMSIYTNELMQKRFFKSGDEKILEALSFNKKLSLSLVEEFLKDETLGSNVARSIELDDELFVLAKKYPTALALNESMSLDMQNELLDLDDENVNYALALNDNLDEKIIKNLLNLNDEKIEFAIYENNSTPQEMLIEAYKNPKTHMPLSKNENTPIDILYQLQLDRRYERFVKTNPAFGRHIQTENIGWEI
ncbi:MAG: hypothetical protein J7J96_04780 [Sulfurimonas sp.]|nr:hypothetical protein [Sulfurimonas sp.]